MYMFMVLVLGPQVHSTTRHIVPRTSMYSAQYWTVALTHTQHAHSPLSLFLLLRERVEMNMNFKKVQAHYVLAICTMYLYEVRGTRYLVLV